MAIDTKRVLAGVGVGAVDQFVEDRYGAGAPFRGNRDLVRLALVVGGYGLGMFTNVGAPYVQYAADAAVPLLTKSVYKAALGGGLGGAKGWGDFSPRRINSGAGASDWSPASGGSRYRPL